jgi:quercetin dioxygenase-like cupin family protein
VKTRRKIEKMAGFVYNGWEFPSVKVEHPNTRTMKIMSSPELNDYQEATILFSLIPPGSTTRRHSHTSDEIIHVVGRDEGHVVDKVTKVETDSVIFAPRGVEHECRNSSDTETLKLFCVLILPLEPTPLSDKLIDKTREYLADK